MKINDLQEMLGEDNVIDIDDENFEAKFKFLLSTTGSSSDYRNDRDRPYNGQPWTDYGERGQHEIRGITMRDLCDCIVQAFLVCSDDEELTQSVFEISNDPDIGKGTPYAANGTWRTTDVHKIDMSKIDPMAVIQNVGCFVEHYMGIFPNTPKEAK